MFIIASKVPFDGNQSLTKTGIEIQSMPLLLLDLYIITIMCLGSNGTLTNNHYSHVWYSKRALS